MTIFFSFEMMHVLTVMRDWVRTEDRGRDPALYCFARLYSALYCPLYSLSHVPSLNITPMPRPIRGQCGNSGPIRGQFLHPSPTSWAGQGVGIQAWVLIMTSPITVILQKIGRGWT